MNEIRDRIREELNDREYRHAYAQEFLDMTLARQIRALRKARGWSQKDLADLLETKQSRISEIEDEEYGALSLATLKDLARVFDVYLNVRFTSFTDLLSQVDRTSMSELVVPRYADDPAVVSTQQTVSVASSQLRSYAVATTAFIEAVELRSTTVAQRDTVLLPPLAYETAA